jgi:uncharacterized membrane protein
MKDFRESVRKLTEPGTPQAAVFFAVLGLIVALLLLLIGFWRTLLVVICCLLGCFLGGVKDKGEFIRRILSRFFAGRQ